MQIDQKEPALSKGDAASMWLFITAGVALFAFTAVQGVLRIIELLRNTDVEVPAAFVGTTATAPIGPDGAPVAVELDRAVLTVDSLPAASVAAGVIESAVTVIATGLVVVLLALLCRELLRGRIFSPRNTKIASAAGITVIVALALGPFFGNMVANGAFARLSAGTFHNAVMAVDLSTLITGAFIAAFVASVFAVGNRLQRDSEGLV